MSDHNSAMAPNFHCDACFSILIRVRVYNIDQLLSVLIFLCKYPIVLVFANTFKSKLSFR